MGPVGSHLDHVVAQVKYRQNLLAQSFFLESTCAKQKKKNERFLFRYADGFVEKLAFWQQHNRESDEGEHHQNDQQGDANALPVPVRPNRSNVLHNNRKNSCRQQQQKHNCTKLWLRLPEWRQNLVTPQCSQQRWEGDEKINDSSFSCCSTTSSVCLSVCLSKCKAPPWLAHVGSRQTSPRRHVRGHSSPTVLAWSWDSLTFPPQMNGGRSAWMLIRDIE